MARVTVAVLYGESMAAAFLSVGLGTVYSRRRPSEIFAPDLESLAWAHDRGLAHTAIFGGHGAGRLAGPVPAVAERVLFPVPMAARGGRNRFTGLSGNDGLVLIVIIFQ